MIARNCTRDDLVSALAVINAERYHGNIRFKSIGPDPRCHSGLRFTLTVNATSSGPRASRQSLPGVRRGFYAPWRNGSGEPRRIAAACWHVHGYFFEALFAIAPAARIFSSSFHHHALDGWITKDHGNWRDSQIGSQAYPLMFSEACDCADQGID